MTVENSNVVALNDYVLATTHTNAGQGNADENLCRKLRGENTANRILGGLNLFINIVSVMFIKSLQC